MDFYGTDELILYQALTIQIILVTWINKSFQDGLLSFQNDSLKLLTHNITEHPQLKIICQNSA